MSQDKGIRRFKDHQTGYHRSAVNILAGWVNGSPEEKFYLQGQIYFVPDVTVYKDGCPAIIYEVVYKNPFTGKKLGKMQMWAYCNAVDLEVYEVNADWILSQTDVPEEIKTTERYIITVF